MDKVKVLHIHTLPVISGSGINVLLSMEKINLSRYEPELACAPGGKLIELARSRGFKVREIKHLTRPLSPIKDLMAFYELVSILRRERYAVVHTHNSKAGIIGRLAAKVSGTPVIIHTVHGFAFHPYEKLLRRKIFILLERLAARLCDCMIIISDALIDWSVKERIMAREKAVRIYSGIEMAKFSPRIDPAPKKKELCIGDNDLVVGQVSKFWDGKGHEVLLQSMVYVLEKIPNVKLVFVGEGETEDTIKRLVNKFNMADKVIFTGFVSNTESLYPVFDIVCVPSLWEGMGRSVLEAMSCGKPVIASRVGGIVDLVKDGVTGLLVPVADAKALSKAIIKLLGDGKLRKKMGEEAIKTMDDRFSADKMAEQIQKVYEKILEKKRPAS